MNIKALRLPREDATEMLADLVPYARKGMDECPIALVRSARMNLPRLLAALNAKPQPFLLRHHFEPRSQP